MNILTFKHPDISQSAQTALTAQANAADQTLSVINIVSFAINQLILIGIYGSEDAEIVKTHASTAPTGSTITLTSAGIVMSHPTDSAITIMDYDQIEISKASAKGGVYSVLATASITPDEPGTTYKDTTGLSTDYYKIRYKNSITGVYSGYSAEIPGSGFPKNCFGSLSDIVFKLFNKASDKILDSDWVNIWLNEGYREAVSQIIDLDIGYYLKYGTDGNGATIPFVANQRAYALPANFYKSGRFRFSYDGANYYLADPFDMVEDYPQNVYLKTNPKYYFESSNIIPLPKPTAASGGILPIYYFLPDDMVNDDDVPNLPVGYHTIITLFALQRAFESDQKFDVAKYYEEQFKDKVQNMLLWVKQRTPERSEITNMWGESSEQDFYDGFVPPQG